MSSVRSKGGRADRALGAALWRRGFRYRRQSKLFGKPDLVFPGPRVVVFVDGDFWHGRCLDERIARGDFRRNADYWIAKLRRNAERDVEVNQRLTAEDWHVIRVWESEVKRDLPGMTARIAEELRRRQGSM